MPSFKCFQCVCRFQHTLTYKNFFWLWDLNFHKSALSAYLRVWPTKITQEIDSWELTTSLTSVNFTQEFYPWIWAKRVTDSFDPTELPRGPTRPMWFSTVPEDSMISVYHTFKLPKLLLPLKISFTGIMFDEYDALIISYSKKGNSFTDEGLFLSLEKFIA